ncbi:MAG: ribosome maturation factor RimP [Syntrophobacteraceae bacterium]|nr:ribosome maturation factor RimP [Syntrophobacteraceae bacterium]
MARELKQEAGELIGGIWNLVEPVILAGGMEILDIEYRRESIGWVLRIFLDSERGINVDDCARISRVVSEMLDTADLVPVAYNLEISSPGIDRPLRKPDHFRKHIGDMIEVRTISPVQNRRNFRGELKDASPEGLILQCDSQDYSIGLELIERARLLYFESLGRKSH